MTFLLPTLAMAASVSLAALATIPSRAAEPIAHAVLVHGAVMDGSSWHGVHDALADHGWTVSVVQLPLTSLAHDVRVTREAIARAPGPLVLVGHSYGGAVISQAGTDPKVARLVYVAATQPDRGESVADLNGRWPMPAHPILLDGNRMIVDPVHFRADIAGDVPDTRSRFLADSQRPTAFEVFTTPLSEAAWHQTPSYGLIATADRTFDPAMLRHLYKRSGTTVIEVDASHSVHISRPDAVARLILEAARDAALTPASSAP